MVSRGSIYPGCESVRSPKARCCKLSLSSSPRPFKLALGFVFQRVNSARINWCRLVDLFFWVVKQFSSTSSSPARGTIIWEKLSANTCRSWGKRRSAFQMGHNIYIVKFGRDFNKSDKSKALSVKPGLKCQENNLANSCEGGNLEDSKI